MAFPMIGTTDVLRNIRRFLEISGDLRKQPPFFGFLPAATARRGPTGAAVYIEISYAVVFHLWDGAYRRADVGIGPYARNFGCVFCGRALPAPTRHFRILKMPAPTRPVPILRPFSDSVNACTRPRRAVAVDGAIYKDACKAVFSDISCGACKTSNRLPKNFGRRL